MKSDKAKLEKILGKVKKQQSNGPGHVDLTKPTEGEFHTWLIAYIEGILDEYQPPRIQITVEGGIVQEVESEILLECQIVDLDRQSEEESIFSDELLLPTELDWKT